MLERPCAPDQTPRTFALHGVRDAFFARVAPRLIEVMRAHGYDQDPEYGDETNIVFYFPGPERPYGFFRRGKRNFVIAVAQMPPMAALPATMPRPFYWVVTETAANLGALFVPTPEGERLCFITPERGYYSVQTTPETFAEALFVAIEPLARARLLLHFEIAFDLPEAVWERAAPVREQIRQAGQWLHARGLLPDPCDDEDIPPKTRSFLWHMFRITGISYGNMSARDPEGAGLWITASGIDKARIDPHGGDVMLITGVDPETSLIRVRMPVHLEGRLRHRRPSVDSAGLWWVYQAFPQIGWMLHFHGDVVDTEGTVLTDFNYPCGTDLEGQALVRGFGLVDNPALAVVRMPFHGCWASGGVTDNGFERVYAELTRRGTVSTPPLSTVGLLSVDEIRALAGVVRRR
jgi:ribulose-5-phosphate 4-epimerase/fuculose-1-phosphate aldolase